MKNRIASIKAVLIVLLIGLTTMSCGDDPLSVTEEAFLKLKGTWGLGSIEVDGVDQSANYPGFTLNFTETGYSATSGGTLFTSGTWQWEGTTATTILLIDGKQLNLVSLTDTSLVFTFTYNSGGTRAGINGNYRVSLVKQQ